MKIVLDGDGNMELRATSPEDNYMLRRWHEDWIAGRVTFKASWKAGEDYTHEPIDPMETQASKVRECQCASYCHIAIGGSFDQPVSSCRGLPSHR